MTPPTLPDSLVFPDRKAAGRFPVTGPNDELLAHITAKWTGASFSATDAFERDLCAGKAARGGLSRRWTATGSHGEPLLSLVTNWTGGKAQVELARGGSYLLRAAAWRRAFSVSTAGGETVLSVTPRGSVFTLRPFTYVVRVVTPVFDLAELVAIVQIWRMVKQGEAAGTVAAGSVATGGAA